MLLVVAVAALELQFSRLGGHNGGTNNDAGYPDQPGDCEGVQISNRHIFSTRVQEELMVR